MKKILAMLAILFTWTIAFGVSQSFADSTLNGKYRVTADWDGLKRGWSTIAFEISDHNLQKVEGAQIQFDYDMASHSMNPPAAVLSEKGAGIYEAKVFFGMRGTWRFNLNITKDSVQDDFEILAVVN